MDTNNYLLIFFLRLGQLLHVRREPDIFVDSIIDRFALGKKKKSQFFSLLNYI